MVTTKICAFVLVKMIPDNLNHGKETQMVIQRSSSISTKQKKVMQISLRTHKFEALEKFENCSKPFRHF